MPRRPTAISFPYMRVRGKVALIGVSSARATAPFMANGFFREDQAHRLAKLLDEAAGAGPVPGHHDPPSAGARRGAAAQAAVRHRQFPEDGAQAWRGTRAARPFASMPSLNWIDGGKKPVPVVGVSAAGQAVGGSHPPAQWNLLEISGEAGAWSLRLTRRGLTGPDGSGRRDFHVPTLIALGEARYRPGRSCPKLAISRSQQRHDRGDRGRPARRPPPVQVPTGRGASHCR